MVGSDRPALVPTDQTLTQLPLRRDFRLPDPGLTMYNGVRLRITARMEDRVSSTERIEPPNNPSSLRAARHQWIFLACIFSLITLVFAVNVLARTNTYISSPDRLVNALVRRVGQIPSWTVWGEKLEQPFPNRVLFRFLYVGVARAFGLGPFGVWAEFVALNYALSLAQAFVLYFYCARTLALPRAVAALSVGLVHLSFTHVFAFEYPVYVIEDLLAYLLLLGGLTALSERKHRLFLACLVLGVLTRETLLILLVVYWLHSRDSLVPKAVAAVLGVAAFAAPRLLLGNMVYNPLQVSLSINLQRPVEALIFVFATFGVLWWTILLAWRENRWLIGTPLDRSIAIWAVILILIASLVGGRLRETRLVFLAFPWIVIPSAAYLVDQFERLKRARVVPAQLRLAVPVFVISGLALGVLVLLSPIRQMIGSAPPFMQIYLLGVGASSVAFAAWQWGAHRYV
jgi:hypothetical protein